MRAATAASDSDRSSLTSASDQGGIPDAPTEARRRTAVLILASDSGLCLRLTRAARSRAAAGGRAGFPRRTAAIFVRLWSVQFAAALAMASGVNRIGFSARFNRVGGAGHAELAPPAADGAGVDAPPIRHGLGALGADGLGQGVGDDRGILAAAWSDGGGWPGDASVGHAADDDPAVADLA
jgi:hypothetical protein